MENNRANKSKTVDRTNDQAPSQLGALIVDDDDLVNLMLRLALEHDGYQVWVAANGQDAISLYRQHRASIDVVLLDVQMPILDGPRTLDALLQIDPDLCACFVSGNTGEYEPEDLIRRGARAVFHKPFRVIDLRVAVRRIIMGEPRAQFDARHYELRAAAMLVEDLPEHQLAETGQKAVAV
jgi:CheY-like chemotaxis protein